jgi:transcriptional regulator with XRE-family HTH domain
MARSPRLSVVAGDSPTLGARIRQLRQARGWSLQQLGAASGIPLSSLSKAETSSQSLPVDRLYRLADALGVSVTQFFDAEDALRQPGAIGRRSVVRGAKGEHTQSQAYDCQWLFADLSQKMMTPIVQTIQARTLEEFGPLMRHEGEEFSMVLAGRVTVISDVYEPLVLEAMDGVYIDSRMGHAYLNSGEGEATILNVSTDSRLRATAREAWPSEADRMTGL